MFIRKERFILFILLAIFVISITVNVHVAEESSLYENDVSLYENDVLGVSLEYPVGYQIVEQQYLSDDYGFSLVDSEKTPVLDINWIHGSNPQQQNQLIENSIIDFPTISIERTSVQIDGQFGTMLAPIPGTETNTLIYISANERIYTLRYYKEALDDFGWSLIKSVHFYPSRRSLDSLQLVHTDDALYISPELEDKLVPSTPEK
ncbi:MAG: hypothetical protein CSB13_01110 [Chloroflexi bacterium]|nr:MAG: hypothetical protein CSB13_01110 [Chloroflexota bacterium]